MEGKPLIEAVVLVARRQLETQARVGELFEQNKERDARAERREAEIHHRLSSVEERLKRLDGVKSSTIDSPRLVLLRTLVESLRTIASDERDPAQTFERDRRLSGAAHASKRASSAYIAKSRAAQALTAPSPSVVASGGYRWVVLAIVCTGVFMTTLDTGIIDILNPIFIREYDLTLASAYWIELAFAIPVIGMLLPAGYLADRLGRKRVFLGGVLLFGIASLGHATAPTFALILASRVLLGTAAACIAATGGVLGIIGSAVAFGLMLGPAS